MAGLREERFGIAGTSTCLCGVHQCAPQCGPRSSVAVAEALQSEIIDETPHVDGTRVAVRRLTAWQ
jgi:hypothetical protein